MPKTSREGLSFSSYVQLCILYIWNTDSIKLFYESETIQKIETPSEVVAYRLYLECLQGINIKNLRKS